MQKPAKSPSGNQVFLLAEKFSERDITIFAYKLTSGDRNARMYSL